jgi:O-antigen/teichoic acid export membrane protein
LFKNVGTNWIVIVANGAATFILMPFVLRTLGQEGYGTWALIVSITGYLGLLALGVPTASLRSFAEHLAREDRSELNKAIGTCVGLYLMMGAASLIIGVGQFVFFNFAYDIPPTLSSEARFAFLVMVLFASTAFIGMLPEGILAAHQQFVLRNMVILGRILLLLVLTLWLLPRTNSMVILPLIQIICLAFDFCVCWLLLKKRHGGIRMSLLDFDWRMVRGIFSFSVYVMIMQVAARIAFETDALIIGAFMDIGQIPFYTVANSLVLYLMEFVIAIDWVVMPMATMLRTRARTSEVRALFIFWSKVAFSLSVLSALYLIVFGPTFIGWWIDPRFEGPSGEVLRILMIAGVIFLPVRGVAYPLLIGLGRPQIPTIAFLCAAFLNLGISVVLIEPLGLAGVAWGTAIPNVLFALLVLVVACREVGISVIEYCGKVVPQTVLASIPVLAVVVYLKFVVGVHAFWGLAGAGTAMVLVFGMMWLVLAYRDNPRLNLRTQLARLTL